MWKLFSCSVILLFLTSIVAQKTSFNQTYILFISEDVPVGHTQLIERYDSSFCTMYTRHSTVSSYHDLPFEILLTDDDSCMLSVQVTQLLDRERISMYSIEQQFLFRNHSISIQLSIVISDVNDHVPRFNEKIFHFTVRENLQARSWIGRVQAFDPDLFLNGQIFYTLSGNDQKVFHIDRDTGDIYLGYATLDYESKREYRMTVAASNDEHVEMDLWPMRSSYADILITVEDVSDEKPYMIFVLSDEDREKNGVQVMNLSTPQLDQVQNHPLTSFRSNIRLLESDATLVSLTREESLPINTLLGLLHIRDNDQILKKRPSINIQTYVRSPDDDTFRNNTLDFFHISILSNTVFGLFTSRVLDREQYETYIIHISLTNENNLSELFLHLTLLDVNDNSPIFNQTYIRIQIDENQPTETFLTRVYAYDQDKGQNGTVRYELLHEQKEFFSFDPYSGILRTKKSLDREQCEWYRIGIRACDLGFPQRKCSSSILVDLQIRNLNDHLPYFLYDVYHFQIEENAMIGQIVGRVTIADRDEQEPIEQMIDLSTHDDDLPQSRSSRIPRVNSSMVDFLFGDSHRNESLSGLFAIDSQGFILTLSILDREYQSNYSLHIFIYDAKLNAYTLPTYVIIEVLDENDHIPSEPFLANSSTVSIEQIGANPIVVYEFHPIDLDEGVNGLVSIECLNCTPFSYFHLINSSIFITRSNVTVPNGIYTFAFLLRDHGLIITQKRLYTLTINFTQRVTPSKQNKTSLFLSSWSYFLLFVLIWFILISLTSWRCYRHDRRFVKEQNLIKQKNLISAPILEIISNVDPNVRRSFENNSQSISFANHPAQSTLHSKTTFSRLHHICTHRQSAPMYSSETVATNTSFHDDIFEPQRESVNRNYHFKPIDHYFSSQSPSSHPQPMPCPPHSNQHPSFFQPKRNSTVIIDPTIRSHPLTRSITSDQLAKNNAANRFHHYPSVQDVLEALNRHSCDKESFV